MVGQDKALKDLLELVPESNRRRAADLVESLVGGRGAAPVVEGRQVVYVAEYEGFPPSTWQGEAAAKEHCESLLRDSYDHDGTWDWFETLDGWVMRATDPETDAPRGLLPGRVTETVLER